MKFKAKMKALLCLKIIMILWIKINKFNKIINQALKDGFRNSK